MTHFSNTEAAYVVKGTAVETGAPWTYWETFPTHQDAFEVAERLNAAANPIVRGCRIELATSDEVGQAARKSAILSKE